MPARNAAPRTLQSDYMHFAKRDTAAAYNLASSGVSDCDLADLDISLADLALHGDNAYGYAPLVERIAARYGAPSECVVTAAGCSFANHLALAALVAPGDEVLVEEPTYELLLATLGYLQAGIRRFPREAHAGWRLDVDEVISRLTPRTRLVVLTNRHNPSSALADPAAIAAVAAAAERNGAHVFIDEVYLELTAGKGQGRTAFHPQGAIVVTNSLTKAYGLSGLRCGWILAPPALAERMRRLNDLYAVAPPHIAERLGVIAFDRLDRLAERAHAMLAANRAAYRSILGGHGALDQTIFDVGTTVFPRLRSGGGDAFFDLLKSRFATTVVPGRFFGAPDHIRIGLGGDPAPTAEGLRRIAEALDRHH